MNNFKRDGFNVDQILNTKLALQRKYKIGEVLDYCQEYLTSLNDLMKILTPVAVRAPLLMTLSIKMGSVISSYKFSMAFIEQILLEMNNLVSVDAQVIFFDFLKSNRFINIYNLHMSKHFIYFLKFFKCSNKVQGSKYFFFRLII